MRIFFIFILIISQYTVYAQHKSPHIVFDTLNYDFGKIKEYGGPVYHRFEFTNTGTQPLIITGVQVSCGCTTPDWSRKPIGPGAKGFVNITFDPRNRPDEFIKMITVTSNADNSPVNIYIRGFVMPREVTVDDIYLFQMGEIKLKSNIIQVNSIYADETKTVSLEIYNSSEKQVNITFDKEKIPAHIKITNSLTLKAKQTEKLDITYNARKKGDWDNVSDMIPFSVNEKNDASYKLIVNAIIKERFTKEQIANPPSIAFESTFYNFGKVKAGSIIKYEYLFKNNGKSDLIIRKLKYATCDCTVIEPKSNIIKPGNSASIFIEFNTANKKGHIYKLITVVTNIPQEDKNRIILKLEGDIIN